MRKSRLRCREGVVRVLESLHLELSHSQGPLPPCPASTRCQTSAELEKVTGPCPQHAERAIIPNTELYTGPDSKSRVTMEQKHFGHAKN